MRREVFGSVVSITPFGTEDEAITWANDSHYALEDYTVPRHVMIKH